MELKAQLRAMNACGEAWKWVGERDLPTAWRECLRADWMLWLAGRMSGQPDWPTRQQVVLAACACAERSLKLVRPDEDRPRLAIETARRWARGEATVEEVRNAAYAAATANATAYAAANAYAAATAAATAYAAAARDSELAVMADIVRSMLTIPESIP